MIQTFLNSAQTGGEGGTTWTSMLSFGVMIVGFVLIYYFMIHRPQKKQDKERNEMLDNLQVGDEITTIGGIIGKVISIKEETCMIETGNAQTKIRILKSSVKRIDVKAEDAE